MRQPRYLDHPNDRKKSRQILLRLLAVYFSLGVLLVGVTHVGAKFTGPQSAPVNQEAVAR
jgi:hypothetical protein